MNIFEILFLNLGLSWTVAKIIPYLLSLVIGVLISTFFFRKSARKKKLLFRTLISVIPLILYFAVFPIYEGDFSNHPYTPSILKLDELKGNDLVVISIPGCPYCFESIEKLNLLKKRNPKMKISFLVCTADKKDLKDYKKAISSSISVKKSVEADSLFQIANQGFPTFVQMRNGKIQRAWSNDSFGVRALDALEKY